MRVYRDKGKKNGKRTCSPRWYIEFRDHTDTIRRMSVFTDKEQTREFGRRIMKMVAHRVMNEPLDQQLSLWFNGLPSVLRDKLMFLELVNSQRAAACIELSKHIEDFTQSLLAKNVTAKRVAKIKKRIGWIFKGCKFKMWSEISNSKVEIYLSKCREKPASNEDEAIVRKRGHKFELGSGLSQQTSNDCVGHLKQFCTWMVHEGRAFASPLVHLKKLNARMDRRHVRRALSAEELALLISTTRKSQRQAKMLGPERGLFYWLASGTGLRWSELRSLTRSSFNLEQSPPTVTVEAGFSKHRRRDTLPLHPDLAAALREHLTDKDFHEPAFNTRVDRSSAMLQADLKEAGIPFRNEKGEVVDFHALRHTFITLLFKSGVHPKVAQKLARHSDIKLTMNVYTHTDFADQAAALDALPSFRDSA